MLEFAKEVVETLDPKYESYFDEETLELYLNSVGEVLQFYNTPQNAQLALNDEIFEERKDEILSIWEDINDLLKATRDSENREFLEVEERKKNMEALGIRVPSPSSKVNALRKRNGNKTHIKNKIKSG